jgi:threonylcarbamoyladenosine tRNA methylthiotransferase MtaB
VAAGYHVENFGCRASRADGEAIDAELRQRGLTPADKMTADVVIVNTCSVTEQADRTARAFLRRVQRENPKARVVVTGCYAQRAPLELAALKGVHAVVGNSHKSLVPEIAAEAGMRLPAFQSPGFLSPSFVPIDALRSAPDPQRTAPVYVDNVFAHSELAAVPFYRAQAERQTRPNLKVQDGCGNRCSFCVIPTTRGHSRSMPLDACLRSVETFVESGGKELVLSGINLGRWGRDLNPWRSFEQLVSAILSRTSLKRLRLSSVEPMDWTPGLIALFRRYGTSPEPRLARHVHLPLQSGSDAILRKMHRRYRPWHYAEKLAAIRGQMPEAAIGADVMVGFPGESEAMFEESVAFIAAQPFTYLHLFPFSARPETPAWNLHRQSPVPPRAVEERMGRLRDLIAAKNLRFRQSFVGRSLSVITLNTPESEHQQGFTRALTDNFLSVQLAGRYPANQVLRATISAVQTEGLTGFVAG